MTEEKKVEEKVESKVESKETQVKEPKKDPAKESLKVKLSQEAENLIKTVEGLTVLELSNLVKALEDKFDVSASMPVMAAAVGGAAAGAGAQEEEKSIFTVELSKVGANKIQVIKEIRTVTSLGLKEAKDLVDSAPKPVKEGATKEEAEEIKKKLEAVGATVELK